MSLACNSSRHSGQVGFWPSQYSMHCITNKRGKSGKQGGKKSGCHYVPGTNVLMDKNARVPRSTFPYNVFATAITAGKTRSQ